MLPFTKKEAIDENKPTKKPINYILLRNQFQK